jgi:hypothetical protein
MANAPSTNVPGLLRANRRVCFLQLLKTNPQIFSLLLSAQNPAQSIVPMSFVRSPINEPRSRELHQTKWFNFALKILC